MTAAGSGVCYLTQPLYKARLHTLSGGDLQIDHVASFNVVGTGARTWGAVKSLYR